MVPIRTGMPYLPWQGPREATRSLRHALPRHGFAHAQQSEETGRSALSVLAEPAVRRKDGTPIRYGTAPAHRRTDGPAGGTYHVLAGQHGPEPSREDRSPTDSVREHVR